MLNTASKQVSIELLQTFTDAWNRHDIDGLMECVTDDCTFDAVGGPDACGARHQGREAVRRAFVQAWASFPDAHWGDGKHFVCGDRGVSEWTFTGTAADGTRIVANGCDVFTFRDGKIAIKNAFRKARPPLPAVKR